MSAPPKARRWKRLTGSVGGCFLAILVTVIFLFLSLAMPGFFESIARLAIGWFPFLRRSLSGMVVNPGMIASGLFALGVSGLLLHAVARWWARQGGRQWSPRHTVSLLVLLIVLFASSICGTGIGHQVGWLMRHPMVVNTSQGIVIKDTNNMRQLFLGLMLYTTDHEGRYPDRLEDLVREGIMERWEEFAVIRDHTTGELEPLLYFGAGLTDASPGDRLVLASARPRYRGNKRIAATSDGSVTTYTEEDFQRIFAEQLKPAP